MIVDVVYKAKVNGKDLTRSTYVYIYVRADSDLSIYLMLMLLNVFLKYEHQESVSYI